MPTTIIIMGKISKFGYIKIRFLYITKYKSN